MIIIQRYSAEHFDEWNSFVAASKNGTFLFDRRYMGYHSDRFADYSLMFYDEKHRLVAVLPANAEGDVLHSHHGLTPPKKAPFSAITVANLMSHSSGIPDARPRDDREFVLKATDMQSIEYMKNLDSLHFQPGTQYEYINPTFQLLYLFIEKISGLPFEQYMHDNIFVPAGMDSTVYFEPDRKIPHMAHGYVTDTPDAKEGAKKFHEYDYGEESFFATKADGGIYTSTHQFIKWIKALRDNKIISAKIKSEAQSPVTKVTGSKYCDYQNRPNTYYGYGWFIEQQPGFPLKVYHTGDNGGFQIYEAFFPSTNLTVLVFENRNDHDRWDMVTALDKILKKAGLMESAR